MCDATYTLWTYDYDDDEASFFAKRFSSNTFIRYDDAFLFIKTVELNFFFKAWKQLSVKNVSVYTNERIHDDEDETRFQRKMWDNDFE